MLVPVRNIAIILAISAAVYFVPGGGTTAAVVGAALGTLFMVVLCWAAVLLYRRFRGDIQLLGDQGQAMLYGAIGAIVIAAAGAQEMFHTPAGIVVWLGLVLGAVYALITLWRRRAYS